MHWRQCSEVQAPLGTDPNLTVTHDFEESHIYVELLLPYGPCLLSLQTDTIDNFLLFSPNRAELNTVLIVQTEIFPLYKRTLVNTQVQASFLWCQNLPPPVLPQEHTKNILNLCSATSDRTFRNDGNVLYLLLHYSSH